MLAVVKCILVLFVFGGVQCLASSPTPAPTTFLMLGGCDFYGNDLRTEVVEHLCGNCPMLVADRNVKNECGSSTYWTNVTNCLVSKNLNGTINPGAQSVPCNQQHALICLCEEQEDLCIRTPTTSPTTAEPTKSPTKIPTNNPTKIPTSNPTTSLPSKSPTGSPSESPSVSPSKAPTPT